VRADYVVIGGGITGLATAWALAKRGREVTVLEQAAIGHRAGGSHGSCRIFRLGYDDAEYVRMARLARELWAELEASCGERLLHPTPQLTFGPQMGLVRAAMREAGAPCDLLSPDEAAERFGLVGADGDILLEPESAVIAADRALAVLTASLRAAGGTASLRAAGGTASLRAAGGTASLRAAGGTAGADVGGRLPALASARADSLADDGRRVRIRTSAGDVDAARVIVCAGPWTAGLLATAGITVPGSATLEQVAYLAPACPAPVSPPPIFIRYGGDFPYGLPVPGTGQYKIGIHHSGPIVDPDRQDQTADQALSERIERAARRFLPGLDPQPVAVERCVYDNSPDTDFIVGAVGNVVIGSGTSGHGFKFGPLLGEWLAALAVGQGAGALAGRRGAATDLPPSRFAPGRF